MANYFNTGISANTAITLFSDLTNILGRTSDFTFCIKLEDTDNYPDDYNLSYELSNITCTITLSNDGSGGTWSVITENDSKSFDGYPTNIAIVIDSTNSELKIYADYEYLDVISDDFSVSTSSDLIVKNDNSSDNNASFSEVLFFDRLLTDDEAKVASSGFTEKLSNVAVDVESSQLNVYQNIATFPNIKVDVDSVEITLNSTNSICRIPVSISANSLNLSVTQLDPLVNDDSNVYIDAEVSVLHISQIPIIDYPKDYVIQQWLFTNGSKYDTNGNNQFTDSETTVENNLPTIITITDEFLYYKPVWNDDNYDYGSGKPKVIGEAQLAGLDSGSKSFSFWIYRPYIADTEDGVYIIIDGNYAITFSPSFGEQSTINSNWSLVVIAYDYELSEKRVYIDNQLSSTVDYVEINNGKFSLTTTEMGEIDTKVAIREITTYSYALKDKDVDAIFNFYYTVVIARPESSQVIITSPFTETWYTKLNNDTIMAITQNSVIINNFHNKYVDNISNTLTIIQNDILNLSEHSSKIIIIQNEPKTIGEAYLDTEFTNLCELYHKSYSINSSGDYVGLIYITQVITPFSSKFNQKLIANSWYGYTINTSIYNTKNDDIFKVAQGSTLTVPYDATYVNRVTNHGDAYELSDAGLDFDVKAYDHAIIFNISKKPTNYYIIASIDYTLNIKVDANMQVFVNNLAIPMSNLELNTEYVLRFGINCGIFINSFKIYSYTNDNGNYLTFTAFGKSYSDTDFDLFNGYICNYKIYTLNAIYGYNRFKYTDNLGLPASKEISDLNSFVTSIAPSFPKLPKASSLLNHYIYKDNTSRLKVIAINPYYVGVKPKTVLVKASPSSLKLYQNFLKHNKNCTVSVLRASAINLSSKVSNCEFITSRETKITISQNMVLVNPKNKPSRIKKIDHVVFRKSLKISSEFEISDFRSSKLITIDGGKILHISKLKQFSKQAIISTYINSYVEYDTILALKELVDDSKHTIWFDDDTYQEFYFDLTSSPLSIEASYEGSDYYKLKIKVLV